LATRIEWLAERGGGTVRVRLDPPSLGEIEIEVRLRNGVAEVVVHTRESDTQALLVGERTAVTQILAARDVRMDDFQVVHQAPPRGDAAASGATGDQTSQRDASARGDAQGGGEGRRDSPPQPGAGDGRAPAPRAFTPPALESTRLDLRV
jgi:flagellar hook-length control protein FliK